MTPEGKVKAKVKRALDKLLYQYRFMAVQNGMGAPALDFFCCISGKFVAIETKVPGKGLTPRQEATKRDIEAACGLVCVIWDDASLAEEMARIKFHAYPVATHKR